MRLSPRRIVAIAATGLAACFGCSSALASHAIPDEFAAEAPLDDEGLDEAGMEYFGKALAKQGYGVVIPDLSPLYIESYCENHDQVAGLLGEWVGQRRAIITGLARRTIGIIPKGSAVSLVD